MTDNTWSVLQSAAPQITPSKTCAVLPGVAARYSCWSYAGGTGTGTPRYPRRQAAGEGWGPCLPPRHLEVGSGEKRGRRERGEEKERVGVKAESMMWRGYNTGFSDLVISCYLQNAEIPCNPLQEIVTHGQCIIVVVITYPKDEDGRNKRAVTNHIVSEHVVVTGFFTAKRAEKGYVHKSFPPQ